MLSQERFSRAKTAVVESRNRRAATCHQRPDGTECLQCESAWQEIEAVRRKHTESIIKAIKQAALEGCFKQFFLNGVHVKRRL